MIVFVKNNYLFLMAAIATIVSLCWLVIAPDFEPVVTSLLGLITCIGLKPKNWGIIMHHPLADYEVKGIESAKIPAPNLIAHSKTENKFIWGEGSLTNKDKSIEFKIPAHKYPHSEWDKVPVRLVLSSLLNTYGENQHFLYLYIADKPPICFHQLDAICAEMTLVDIDNDGRPELLLGYKCGAHSEGIKVFKLDESLNFNKIEGSDIGSDFPLITWGNDSNKVFFINSYSRNWGGERGKWHSVYEKYIFKSSKFEIKTTAKIKWKNS